MGSGRARIWNVATSTSVASLTTQNVNLFSLKVVAASKTLLPFSVSPVLEKVLRSLGHGLLIDFYLSSCNCLKCMPITDKLVFSCILNWMCVFYSVK